VTLSNSVLVVAPCPDNVDSSEHQVVVQDSLNELLELVPAVPRLHRLNTLLKEHRWEEGHEEEEDNYNTVGLHFELHRYL
jgi:sister chromatid cohesion protein DCC1